MEIQKVAAVVIIVGSILFLIAAFSPISMAFFTERDPARQLAIATEGKRAWIMSQILFSSGGLVTAVGTGLTAVHLRNIPNGILAYLAFALLLIGAMLWVWQIYIRTGDPRALIEGTIPAWPFTAYTLLTQFGLAILGVVLIRTAVPDWTSWMLILGAIISFLLFIGLKDMPPFVYYILFLVLGIMLFRT